MFAVPGFFVHSPGASRAVLGECESACTLLFSRRIEGSPRSEPCKDAPEEALIPLKPSDVP